MKNKEKKKKIKWGREMIQWEQNKDGCIAKTEWCMETFMLFYKHICIPQKIYDFDMSVNWRAIKFKMWQKDLTVYNYQTLIP